MDHTQARGIQRLRGGAEVIPLRTSKKRFVSVTGGKGGVGKSTLATNLAVHFGRTGSRTAIVDGDVGMADLNLLLGVAPERSLLEVAQGGAVADSLIEAHGVQLLPGLNGSYGLANATGDAKNRIRAAVNELADDFETVVVDIAAGIDVTSMEIAAAAHDILVVATPDPTSLADAYACMKVLSRHHSVERAFFVPNSVRSREQGAELTEQLSALTGRFLDIELIPLPHIPVDASVGVAASAGVPLVNAFPDAPASRAITRLARTLDTFIHSERKPEVMP